MIKGECPVCGFRFALRRDATMWRHWAGFTDRNDDGTCKGWRKPPKAGVTQLAAP